MASRCGKATISAGSAGTSPAAADVTGPHLHFALRRDGKYVPIAGYVFGRWVIHAGAEPYQGFARRGSVQVPVGVL